MRLRTGVFPAYNATHVHIGNILIMLECFDIKGDTAMIACINIYDIFESSNKTKAITYDIKTFDIYSGKCHMLS